MFGVFGFVYYGLILIVCVVGWDKEDSECNAYTLVISAFAAVFIFVQMHFVFCNSKVHWHKAPFSTRL